jgi:hypothetical protein
MAVAITVPDISEQLRTISDWQSEPETRRWMQETASDVLVAIEQSIVEDTTLRTPREAADRLDGFRAWLNRYDETRLNAVLRGYRFQMALQFEQEFERRFPAAYGQMHNRTVIRDTFIKLVWPDIETQFRNGAYSLLSAYAVRSIGLAFLSRSIGDNLRVGIPERRSNEGGALAVFAGSTERHIATIQIDNDGAIISDTEELRQQVNAAFA